MKLVIHSLIREASMHCEKEKQRRITSNDIREVTTVGMLCDFDVTKEG